MRHHILLRLTVIFIFFSAGNVMKAQQWINGHIADYAEGTFLPSVTVELLKSDSTLISRTVTNNDKGYYGFKSPGKGDYLIHCTLVGYDPVYKNLHINVPKRITEVDVDLIRMKRKVKTLKTVKVVATKIKMVMHGDTVVYNADAFHLAEGSMLNELVSQLPGVTLKDNGQIYVNGRFVSSLMLNGRDFFQGNPLMALENLPAYIVKNVKVYDKAGEMSRLLGRDAGDKALVMDVYLKKEYNEGYIVNADNGYGSKDRYKSQLFGLRFTNLSRLSFFSNINNINNKNRPGSNGDWKGEDPPTGRMKVVSAGAEYNYENKAHDFGLTLTPILSSTHVDNRDWTSGQTYLSTGSLYQRATDVNLTKQMALSAQNKFWLRKKDWSGTFNLNLDYLRNRLSGLSRNALFMDNPQMSTEVLDSIESNTLDNTVKNSLYNYLHNETSVNGETYKAKLETYQYYNIKGDMLTFAGTYSYDKDYDHTYSLYQLNSYRDGETIRQHTYRDAENHGYNIDAQLGYERYLSGKTNDILIFHYKFSEKALRADNFFYQLDRDSTALDNISWLPSNRQLLAAYLDNPNSYRSNEHDYTHNIEAIFRYSWIYKKGHTVILYVRMPLDWQLNNMNYWRVNHYDINRKRLFFNPNTTLSLNILTPEKMELAILSAKLSHEMPMMENLAPYTDNSDPHLIVKGNPSLTNLRTLNASASYMRQVNKHQQHFSTRLDFTNLQGAVANALYFDTATGIQTIEPHNMYGNWNLKLAIGGGRAIALHDRLSLDNNLEATYLHSVDMNSTSGSAPRRSPVNNFDLKDALHLNDDVSSSLKIGLMVSGTLDRVSSEIHSFDRYQVGNYAFGCNATWNLPLAFQLSTDFRVSCNRGYSDHSMNKDEYVWNARLTKTLLKGNLQLMLDGFDILGQLSNHHYVLNSQGRIETYSNAIPRYMMLHVAYRFHKNPAKNNAPKQLAE